MDNSVDVLVLLLMYIMYIVGVFKEEQGNIKSGKRLEV